MLKGKRIFISGGNGVIGNTLVEKLHRMGAILLVGDLKPRPLSWHKDILYWKGDLNYITRGELQSFNPEYFFHLAATFERSTETYEFWDENYRHNVRLSHHLMTLLKDIPSLKSVIFASSYLIYDPALYNFKEAANRPYSLKETDPISPRNLTGSAKLNHEIELRFLDEFRREQLQIISARIYRSYGRNSRDVISRWIRALIKGEAITVFRKEGIFDYIYADDVAEGLVRLANTDFRGIVNLGNGNARKVEEVLGVLRLHFPQMKCKEVDSDIPYEASQADMTLFQKVTGWKPQKRIEQAIPEIIAFEKARNAKMEEDEAPLNILATSISKKIPMLKAIKNAAGKYGTVNRVYGGDGSDKVIGKHFVDYFWKMPRLENLDAQTVINYCLKNKIKLIIPSRDGELPFWAKHKSALERRGINVMVSSVESVNICLDKLKFYQTLKKSGLPAIPTAEKIDGLKKAARYVVKERYGAGSQNIGLNLTRQEAINHSSRLVDPIFQPFISGMELSVDMYVSKKGKVKGVICRSRDVLVNGESQITTTVDNPQLEKLAVKIAEKLKLYGHIVLQVMVDSRNKFHIIECNSRFGGASTLSVQCGLDSFYWAMLEASEHDIDEYPFVKPKETRMQIRFPEDMVVYGAGV